MTLLSSQNIYRYTKIFGLVWALLLAHISAWAQVKGKFIEDSIGIGIPVKYVLSFKHPEKFDVFFPDSTYNFAPFELVKREYTPTSTQKGISLDSVIYTLILFEVKPIQKLQLPVYIRTISDCTKVMPLEDSIYFQSMIPAKAKIDTLQLKMDTQPIHLTQQANYPLMIMVFMGLGAFGMIIFWLFGKPIKRQIKLFQFRRRFDEYQRVFQRLSKDTNELNRRLENVEKALVLWKKYIERLEEKPFTTFTTKEILDNIKDARLPEALREIDATIYGGNFSKKTVSSLAILQELAEGLYREHRQDLIDSPV